MSSRPVRTAILSDRDLIFHGLVGLLAAHADQVEVLDRRDELTSDADVHVVVLDADSYDGPRLVLPTSPQGVPPAVVVLASHGQRTPGGRSTPAGGEGVVNLSVTGEELVRRIRAAALTPHGERAAGALDGRLLLLDRSGGLSAREVDVVGLIALGLSNHEIAARLYLSINSVKTYVRTAYRKMGVATRSQAVGWASARGFPMSSAGRDLDQMNA